MMMMIILLHQNKKRARTREKKSHQNYDSQSAGRSAIIGFIVGTSEEGDMGKMSLF